MSPVSQSTRFNPSMPRTLTWLHISDLHARLRDDWDSRKITDALIRDLKKLQRERGLRPDFIFFTGDAAFGAANGEKMMDQYQKVRLFFEGVRSALNLKSRFATFIWSPETMMSIVAKLRQIRRSG